MFDENVILVCTLLLLMQAITATLTAFTKRSRAIIFPLFAMCIFEVIWTVFQMLHFATVGSELSKTFYQFQMLGIPFIPIMSFWFTLKLFDIKSKIVNKAKYFVFIIPVITAILSITNDYHHLFRSVFEIIDASPSYIMINAYGPWFYIHTYYSYIFIAGTVILALLKSRNLSIRYRLPHYLIVLGCIAGGFFGFLALFVVSNNIVDPNLIGITVGSLLFYMAMEIKEKDRYFIARNEIFESLSDITLILDMNDNIVDYNAAAKNWAKDYDIADLKSMTFEQLKDKLISKGADFNSDSINELYETNVYIPDENNSTFKSYSLQHQNIQGRGEEMLGTIISFFDITSMVRSLRNLTEMSSIDPLTSLLNRRGYDKLLEEYDTEGHMPLSIIIGDVNGLKSVNDTLGHIEGDLLLQAFSKIFIECTSNIGMSARIGGDEYALLLPNFDEEKTLDVITRIRQKVASQKDSLHNCTIALGYAIKNSLDEDTSELIKKADVNMYADKANDRRCRRS